MRDIKDPIVVNAFHRQHRQRQLMQKEDITEMNHAMRNVNMPIETISRSLSYQLVQWNMHAKLLIQACSVTLT